MQSSTKQTDSKVLLAMPVYNEQKHLDRVLDEVRHYIDNIMVIDDGSTDDTKLILAKRRDVCVVSHKENCGYGRSIISAFQFAANCGHDWVITMDCDFQHEPAQIPEFIEAIRFDDSDVISGSRYMSQFDRNDSPPQDRRRINKIITGLINDKLELELTDAFCGFKACRLSAMTQLDLTETGYAFPLEFWVQVIARNLRVSEIPVKLIYNDPDRHFGGELDVPDTRLEHYKEVLDESLRKIGRL